MLLKPGDMFGDYRVVCQLGKGGMAEVWLLEIESRKEFCAVKLLYPEKAGDRNTRRRFLSEARLSMEIPDPNLVRVFDIGEDPDSGLCYILMEYVPGGTLADWLADLGRLPMATAVSLTRDVALMMERTLLPRGIVHRDLKPSNIMFASDGSFRLADLGSAHIDGSGERGLSPSSTGMMGVFLGTPAYMAPEQMLDPADVDYRADIYSLGVIFFEMLTGSHPYPNLSAVQIMARAVTGEAIPDVRTVCPTVPAVLANVIRAMCEPKREARVESPQWIADCCGRVLERM